MRRKQLIPGSLTAGEVAANPRQANPALAPTGGIRGDIDEFRRGVTYTRPLFGQDQLDSPAITFHVPCSADQREEDTPWTGAAPCAASSR